MQITRLLTSAVIRRKLHGADAGATLALHLARRLNMHSSIGLGEWLMSWSHPRRDGSHRAERTPGARRIDERQGDTNDSGHHDNRPKYATYSAPHCQTSLAPGNGKRQLGAEHTEDEEHHEQTETEGTHKGWYRLMW